MEAHDHGVDWTPEGHTASTALPDGVALQLLPGALLLAQDYGGDAAYHYRCRMQGSERMLCVFDDPTPGPRRGVPPHMVEG
ncbi:MAG TPA: hypothetical protein VKH19_10555 [Gemmatimonadaceae bacterium]|nr:hypothetical protein [Gemmatimonadaceae bacterium]